MSESKHLPFAGINFSFLAPGDSADLKEWVRIEAKTSKKSPQQTRILSSAFAIVGLRRDIINMERFPGKGSSAPAPNDIWLLLQVGS